MATAHATQLIRDVYAVYNDRQFERVDDLVTDDFTFVMIPTGRTFHGPDGMREYFQSWAAAFPESTVEITNLIATDDQAAVEFTGRGLHAGPLLTPEREIPPTGRRVEVQFCDVYELRDG